MAEPRLEESGQCKEKAPARSWRHGISLALMYAEVITLSRKIFWLRFKGGEIEFRS
jgi:hypothetical protein